MLKPVLGLLSSSGAGDERDVAVKLAWSNNMCMQEMGSAFSLASDLDAAQRVES